MAEDDKEVFTNDSAKEYLMMTFHGQVDPAATAVDPRDATEFGNFVNGVDLAIKNVDIPEEALPRVKKSELKTSLFKNIFKGSAFHSKIHARFRDNLEGELSKQTTSESIIRAASKLNLVNQSNLHIFFRDRAIIPVNVSQYDQIVDEVFSETDPGLVSLLDSARKYINEKHPKKSFVLIMEDDTRRLGFGVRIEDGIVENIGINHITAACQSYTFDKIKDGLQEIDNGVKILPVENEFSQYPEHYMNPYVLPADLFLLKASTDWGNSPLIGTRVQLEIESGLNTS